MSYRTEQEIITAILDEYKNGVTQVEVAAKYNVAKITVIRIIKQHLGSRKYTKVTDELRNKIYVDIHIKHSTQTEVATKYNLSRRTIQKILEKEVDDGNGNVYYWDKKDERSKVKASQP